tara:strand:+ start:14464 stop:15513 length:1050 start_codon:yes stop_codon:yes gene_type:complete
VFAEQFVMEDFIGKILEHQHTSILLAIVSVSIYILMKGADLLVREVIILSRHLGVPSFLIGATIVSLGTTFPEAAVSVFAAVQGKPDLALGNAVGSIICDTGLILGIATLISPPRLPSSIVNRQGWIQLGVGFLLVFSAIPYANLRGIPVSGGRLPQTIGLVFLVLLVIYLYFSIRWAQRIRSENENESDLPDSDFSTIAILGKLVLGIILVVVSSQVLIPAAEECAIRFNVPDSVIATTIVAFGTSLPELVTAITAVRRGHGELAVGNIIGADILNVLFVAGSAAAVTRNGLSAPPLFFYYLFPAMLFILIVFRVGILVSGDRLNRGFGMILLSAYLVITFIQMQLER